MKTPDINTRFVTLVGTPLSQSFAARMQNAHYEAADLNYMYFYTEAGSEQLEAIINGIRFMPSFAGCAVTKPNKVAVLGYLDELDPLCRAIGSCNTVVKLPDGRLRGYNTDALGFYKSLVTEGETDPAGKSIFCFGAGGVGRAICCILADKGASKLFLTDIYEPAAKELVREINQNIAPIAEYVPYGTYEKVTECEIVINASGIGFGKTVGETPLPKEYIREGQFYFDACYNPAVTRFLENAAAAGCRTLNGLEMSLYQGAAQIELWTGREAALDVMKAELERAMAENRK